jgi:GTP cyclohydrolase II
MASDPHTSLFPTPAERVSRARADLRMGVPVVMAAGTSGLVVLAAETAGADRVRGCGPLGGAGRRDHAWRAETLKARAYDGDLARIVMPRDVDETWLADIADPARDLMAPMKGPASDPAGGRRTLHRLAILLAKSAQLLPCVLACRVSRRPVHSPLNTASPASRR